MVWPLPEAVSQSAQIRMGAQINSLIRERVYQPWKFISRRLDISNSPKFPGQMFWRWSLYTSTNMSLVEIVQRLIELSPFYKSRNGETYCFFCKEYQADETKEDHAPNCIFAMARKALQDQKAPQ
jgi:hypothetical protein